jgi:hypothetical protein
MSQLNLNVLKKKVLKEVNTKTGKKHAKLTALEFCSQVVAGLNYFVKVKKIQFRICKVLGSLYNKTNFFTFTKVKSNDGSFLHLCIHKPLPHMGNDPLLHGVKENVNEHVPIEHF